MGGFFTKLYDEFSCKRKYASHQLTAGGAPSLLGPSLDGGGSALFKSFRLRSEVGRIMYNITAKIINSIIMKKLSPTPWFGTLGKSMHSFSVQ